ncbi:MAG: hypothetical protein A3D95_09100 [Betaproteobacteria bacterium RIFCSPHIGHO2_12_FULL_69_13]|nr:MAG: hypothetical protein A3D95_09100 [Betaproteobacteria bacterium RIFCSPHIGHO2_12_FULL_69_13]OGA65747.1 MAG: hypothetical protein A3G83_02405 [Betaproteobacteria bacterium RIFCSPLOWO2_12_FULL_68_20]
MKRCAGRGPTRREPCLERLIPTGNSRPTGAGSRGEIAPSTSIGSICHSTTAPIRRIAGRLRQSMIFQTGPDYNAAGNQEKTVATVTVRIPESLLKRAQAATGRRDAEAAVRRALEIATRDYELNAAARRTLEQSRREEREGKVRRFSTARDAVAYLKRL